MATKSGNNILFVTNEDEIVQSLSNQLILLRNIDSILIRLYADAVDTIDSEKPQSIIITCSSREEEASCLETINLMKRHTVVPIILIVREYNEDFIQLANKEGISDCITIEFSQSEVLMRTIWSLQKNEISEKYKKHLKILEQLKVIDKNTGFYTIKNFKRIFHNELEYINNNNINSIIMAVTPNRNSGLSISKEKLDEAIKNNVRGSDVTLMYNEQTYFLVLANTNLSGAMIVWTRLNKAIGADGTICGCITDASDKTYEQLVEVMCDGLEVAITTPNNFLAISEDVSDEDEDWLEDKSSKGKSNLKLFKQIYNKKSENIIKPILEFAKKSAKRKLPKVNLELEYEELKSSMILSKKNNKSVLEFEHSGSSFVQVKFIHEGLDSPENKTAKVYFNEVSEQSIKDLIDTFILEFLDYVK